MLIRNRNQISTSYLNSNITADSIFCYIIEYNNNTDNLR